MTNEKTKGLEIVAPMNADDTKFFLAGEDISGELQVTKVTAEMSPHAATKVTLEVYPESLVLRPGAVRLELADGSMVCEFCSFFDREREHCKRLEVPVRKNFGCVDYNPGGWD